MSGVLTSSLPAPDAVARVLRDLFGKGVTQKKAPASFAMSPKAFAATYLDDRDALVGICLCDVPLAATIGSALALVPPDAANAAVKAGKLSGEMLDNFREVLNILHRQFGALHVRFKDLVQPGDKVPANISAGTAKPSSRLDLEIIVAGYPAGRLTFLLI
jgi:hypothetical protein